MDPLEQILKKLEKIDDRLVNLGETSVKQEANLAEHMRRTDLLEKKVDKSEIKLVRIIYLLVLGAGASGVYYWPVVRELLRFAL